MIKTLTRIGIYERPDLYDRLLRFNPDFKPTRSVLGNTKQFAYFEEQDPQYLIMVSRTIAPLTPKQEYNFVVTVTSENENTSTEVIEDLSSKTGIVLRESSPEHSALMNNISATFPVFKKLGRRALEMMAQI